MSNYNEALDTEKRTYLDVETSFFRRRLLSKSTRGGKWSPFCKQYRIIRLSSKFYRRCYSGS
jgi:hypothetical protein